MSPFIYPIFIFLLPIKISNARLLFLSFGMGLTVDIFSNTGGIHAAASVFIAYLRPFLLNNLMPGGKLEDQAQPDMEKLGLVSFLIYTGSLLLIHHYLVNLLDVYSFRDFWYTFTKSLLSAVFALIIVLMYVQVFKRK
jgi:hypothetical protein